MLMNNYFRVNLSFKKGHGATLTTDDGKDFIDFGSGIGVCSLGHAPKGLARVIAKQADTLIHTSNLYKIAPQEELANRICKLLGSKYYVFFANSGAEANECAIKLARKYGASKGKREIISLANSFHGRTIATLKLTGQEKFHSSDFAPYPDEFSCYSSIDEIIKNASDRTAAVMIELIQGEGGINALDLKEVAKLAKFCKERDILLITDEVQCGVYRSGEFVTSKLYGISPDIITFAKGLAGGVPIGACASKHDIFAPGDHGSTFGGNFLSSVAGNYVLGELSRLKKNGSLDKTILSFSKELDKIAKKYKKLIKARTGLGAMLGLELKEPELLGKLYDAALKNRLLVLKSGKATLRFLPPLNITQSEMKKGFKRLNKAFLQVVKEI